MTKKLKEDIGQAQMVLVGIGQEFAYLTEKTLTGSTPAGKTPEAPAAKAGEDSTEERERRLRAYQKLASLLEGKNYFIVTLCTDDLIFDTALEKGRIVAPCGGKRYLQCPAGCAGALTDTAGLPEEQRLQLEAGEFPVCSRCGARLCYNNMEAAVYDESGYLPQWEKYRKWLTGTVNRSLCILELGAGMEFPSIVRWPFEKIAYLNEKARFYRVHSRLYQLTEEINGRAVSVAKNPLDFLLEGK